MEKEFIPYTIALELKELGFDEPCLGGYIKFQGSGTFELAFYKYRNVDFNTTSNIYVSAPLYQQIFRWFREKYDLICRPTIVVQGTKKWYNITVIVLDDKNYTLADDYTVLDTYEEAEIACLKKLIELVKKL